MTDRSITKCERCFIKLDKAHGEVIFHEWDDKLEQYFWIPDTQKTLCSECLSIVQFASSPESWVTTTADTKAKKLYYFDKKQEE